MWGEMAKDVGGKLGEERNGDTQRKESQREEAKRHVRKEERKRGRGQY